MDRTDAKLRKEKLGFPGADTLDIFCFKISCRVHLISLKCKYRKNLSGAEKITGISGFWLILIMNCSKITGFFAWLSDRILGHHCLEVTSGKAILNRVFADKTNYPEYKVAFEAKKELLHGPDSGILIDMYTHGACSNRISRHKTLSSIVRRSSVSTSQGRILFRLSRTCRPAKIIELGTSAGISALYLALGSPGSEVITVEGNTHLAEISSGFFNRNKIRNIKVMNTTFNIALDDLKSQGIFDTEGLKLVFVDGDHSYQPVLRYYTFLKDNLLPPYILAFHDIYWSSEMKKSWDYIVRSAGKCNTADLFSMGIVFNE